MSKQLQAFLVGSLVGVGCFAYTRHQFWTSFEGVSRDIKRYHLEINPDKIIDQPPSLKLPARKSWFVGTPTDTSYATGRKPADAWNHYVRQLYKRFALSCY